jgi:hypothetical protein
VVLGFNSFLSVVFLELLVTST